MGDLLKEAIADAKAGRETALQNAKMALEEAFTPQLKSILAAKLREDDDEFGDEEEVPSEEPAVEDEFGDEEGGEEEIPAEEMGYEEEEGDEEVPAEEDPVAEIPAEEEDEFGGEEEVPGEEEPEVAETLEINGRTYRLAEEEDEEGEEIAEEEEGEEGDLDLEAVIRELETEIAEGEEEDEDDEEISEGEGDGHVDGDGHAEGDVEDVEQAEHVGGNIGEATYEVDDSVLEQSDSSDIGTGDYKVDVADASDEEDPGSGDDKPGTASKGGIGEAFNQVTNELNEYKQAVKFLKDKLHEVNILNAKLLFTNKLFKEFALDNSAKLKVVENFDRAQTVREIKLVYATLAESFKDNSNVKRRSINESASTKSGTTKPKKKIISESGEVANRFKKLAGLI